MQEIIMSRTAEVNGDNEVNISGNVGCLLVVILLVYMFICARQSVFASFCFKCVLNI